MHPLSRSASLEQLRRKDVAKFRRSIGIGSEENAPPQKIQRLAGEKKPLTPPVSSTKATGSVEARAAVEQNLIAMAATSLASLAESRWNGACMVTGREALELLVEQGRSLDARPKLIQAAERKLQQARKLSNLTDPSSPFMHVGWQAAKRRASVANLPRQEAAKLRLQQAMRSRDIEELEASIAEAKEACVLGELVADAKEVLSRAESTVAEEALAAAAEEAEKTASEDAALAISMLEKALRAQKDKAPQELVTRIEARLNELWSV